MGEAGIHATNIHQPVLILWGHVDQSQAAV
jgi:hypothetical protein